MLERWNDDRMDAFEAKVDKRFERLDSELLEQRREMKAGFETLNERFDRMQRTMLWAAVTIIVALLGSGSAIAAAVIG